jgi:hypothetical protein
MGWQLLALHSSDTGVALALMLGFQVVEGTSQVVRTGSGMT